MGEARRRGSFEKRKRESIKQKKEALLNLMGGRDERTDAALRAGIEPFLAQLSPGEWETRCSAILDVLKNVQDGQRLEHAKPIRVQDDEIIWYLFLCRQALDDPLCNDVSQVARAAPYFAGIGERWKYSHQVKGLEKKIDEVVHQYRKEPDGLIFEILVALSYAEAGWKVELLEAQSSTKSPDMLVRKERIEYYVECKRLARRTGYAEKERNEFLRLWDAATQALWENRQWLWFHGVFHKEVESIPTSFLSDVFYNELPISSGEKKIYHGSEATIHARLIDHEAVKQHLQQWQVKTNSAMLSHLLGGDWAPMNSSVSIIKRAKFSYVADCDVPALGGYVTDIDWACGFTRDFDSEKSLNKKAKDVTKYLSDAVKQLPEDRPSIIHIAAETLEGKEVERLRTEKVMASIPSFVSSKPVVGVRFHRFQANQTIDKLWEFDETVERFSVDYHSIEGIPEFVVIPESTDTRQGPHWDLYE